MTALGLGLGRPRFHEKGQWLEERREERAGIREV